MKNISLKPIKKIKITWKVSSGLTDYNTAINMMNKYIKDIKVSKLSDIIWLLAGWCWNQIPEKVLQSKKVVCTIHHEVPSKFNEYENVMYKLFKILHFK